MSIYRRIFTSVIACGLVLGSVFFIRLQLSNTEQRRKSAPEFLPNVARFRAPRVCSQRALILVHSGSGSSHRRQVIRETWAHPTVTQPLDVSVGFGVGTAVSGDLQRGLDWEAEIYGDVFQGDSGRARSASETVMQLLKTARSACPHLPRFVLKTDDDVFVNTFSFVELLDSLETSSSSSTMWCVGWDRKLDKPGSGDHPAWMVVRSINQSDDIRPSYCIGAAYLMTGRALDAIIRRHEDQGEETTMLPEEVYVTGVLTREAGVTLSLLGERRPLGRWVRGEEADANLVVASLGDQVEEDADRLWRVLVREKLNDSRRSDVGL